MTERELLNVLERHGIRRIQPMSEPFNPHLHQAVMEMQRTDVPAGTIVQVFQAGFIIEDRVLRPAMVAVAKGGPKPAPAPEAPPVPRHAGRKLQRANSRSSRLARRRAVTRRSVRLNRPPSASSRDVPGWMRSMPW